MAKNIVLCSDGTGNAGGRGKETNVWRIYQAINRNSSRRDQIAFYDDGVGTEENKYLKLIGGAFGAGFTRNVKDLYKTLVKNYTADDDIYMFGFSRGAYTVRALAAFVAKCGVITDARAMTERGLDDSIERLIDEYWRRTDNQTDVTVDGVSTTQAKIKCVGVWDTVSAIGLPFDIFLEQVILRCFKFRFRDQYLSPGVEYGFHALAIEDERLTFRPVIWNARANVEQVWFAGVHSNVGGGYPKQGMAYLTLDWMMERVEHSSTKGWGLDFDASLRAEARHFANVHDKLYDSRAGVAAYYRYAPRDIQNLTPSDGAMMVHDSVFDRIEAKTLAYNPGNIPSNRDIDVVTTGGTPPDLARQTRVNANRDERGQILEGAQRWINARKALHFAFVIVSLAAAFALLWYGIFMPKATGWIPDEWLRTIMDRNPELEPVINLIAFNPMGAAAVIVVAGLTISALFWRRDICLGLAVLIALAAIALSYEWILKLVTWLLPDILVEPVEYFTTHYPFWTLVALAILALMHVLRWYFRQNTAEIFERACDTLRP